MKEMTSITHNTHIQGVTNMKKSFLLVAMSAMLLFAFASSAMAKNAGSPAITGDTAGRVTSSVNATSGYVYWSAATRIASLNGAAQSSGPHGNYTTTTIKCAVCHSVHGAPSDSALLLPMSDVGSSCSFCHASGGTVTPVQVSLSTTGNTPHSGCLGYCHSYSPHGVGASEYLSMKAKLLVNTADTRIGKAIIETAETSITASLMASTVDHDAVALGTGYVCSRFGCHNNAGSAFAIKGSGNSMNLQTTTGPLAAGNMKKSGHPVTGALSSDWGANHVGGLNPTAVAFASVASGCNSCHDYVDPATTRAAFPHNRLGTRLWMTAAANAGVAVRTPILETTTNVIDGVAVDGTLDYYPTSIDGACIKCHVSAANAAGVGVTF